jgi:hypothetical protein
MPTRLFLALITLTLFAAINASGQSSPSSSIDVVYILNNGGIETYDVDPKTGIPTDEGLFGVPPENPVLSPSLDDHFVYVIGNNPGSGALQLWVYATNLVGLPQYPPLQTINFESFTSYFSINPNGTLAYAVQYSKNSQGEALAGIRYFTVNPSTGLLVKSPKVLATYPPNGPCGEGAEEAGFSIVGFDPRGDKLYDAWSCEYHDSFGITYYTRQVDQKTGALGPDVETFSWSNGDDGFDYVHFSPIALMDYEIPNDYQQGINSLNVYPLNGGSPIFSCTASMLQVCGNGISATVDPSGNYIFFQTGIYATEITKLDLANQQVVPTGSSFPDAVQVFSPDDKLIYSTDQNANGIIHIYTFDAAAGSAKYNGGEITVGPLPFYSVVPTLRK